MRSVDIFARLYSKDSMNQNKEQNLKNEILGRVGGEEFALLLPETPFELAKIVAERLRIVVEKNVFETTQKKPIQVTVSIGCCSVEKPPYPDLDVVYSIADKCLYESKNQGKNMVISTRYIP